LSFTRATIAGAGLAGLSAAVRLAGAGLAVSLGEAAAQAGGRCRSYHDPKLGLVIDNGNHLVLSGNAAVARFREVIGARTPLAGPPEAAFPFADLNTGERWTLRMNGGRLLWWPLSPRRRAPGTKAGDYLALLALLRRGDAPIGTRMAARGMLWDRLVDPVMLAVLNTPVAEGSSALAGAVLRQSVLRGGRASAPRIVEPNLAAAFIDPALAWLEARGAPVRFGRRLRGLAFAGDRISALDWGQGPEEVAGDEAVILAVPPWIATELLPGLAAPDRFHAIVNGHFAMPAPDGAPLMLGLIGGTAQWVFALPGRISVTVSAADAIVEQDRERLAETFWADIRCAYGIDAPMPAWQIVKEKRATFSATPEQNARRPGAATAWGNLFLAGDWTQTGLPATIEGALLSGERAAYLALQSRKG
jgi:squalene-associated FAD-dependent desaturase